eukprot:scaffold62042_cov73-Cyclotella_meneghiniana.AAC.3
MDESTPLNSASSNGNGTDKVPPSTKNWKLVRNALFTWSERERTLREKGVGQAAQLCRDAVFGYQDAPYEGFYDPYGEENQNNETRNEISVLCGRLVAILRGAVVFTNCILFLLVFIEPPYWCRNGDKKLYGDCRTIFELIGTTADGEEDNEAVDLNRTPLFAFQRDLPLDIIW